MTGPKQEQSAVNPFDQLRRNRPGGERTPPRKTMGRQHQHIDVFLLDHTQQGSDDVVSSLDSESRRYALVHKLVLAIRKPFFDGFLPLLKYCGLGKEVSPVEVGYLRDDMDQVDAGIELPGEARGRC